MDSLLTLIALWLSFNFGLPAIPEPPKINVVPAQEIMFMRYGAFTSKARQEILAMQANVSPGQRREPIAIYDEASGTIFLPEGWASDNPTDVSVLVHEMVHHMQKRAGLRYDCPAAREELAYLAQDQWLKMFGKNLFDELNLDAFTLKVTTSCGF